MVLFPDVSPALPGGKVLTAPGREPIAQGQGHRPLCSALPASARGRDPGSGRAQFLLYEPSVLPSPGRKDPALSLLSCRSPRLTPWAAMGILHQWTWGHGGDWLPESTGQRPRKGARRTSSCSDHQSDSRLQLRPRAGPPSRSQDVAVTCYKCTQDCTVVTQDLGTGPSRCGSSRPALPPHPSHPPGGGGLASGCSRGHEDGVRPGSKCPPGFQKHLVPRLPLSEGEEKQREKKSWLS